MWYARTPFAHRRDLGALALSTGTCATGKDERARPGTARVKMKPQKRARRGGSNGAPPHAEGRVACGLRRELEASRFRRPGMGLPGFAALRGVTRVFWLLVLECASFCFPDRRVAV